MGAVPIYFGPIFQVKLGAVEPQHLQGVADGRQHLLQGVRLVRLHPHGQEGPPLAAEPRHVRHVLEPAVELVEGQVLQVAGLAHQDQRPALRAAAGSASYGPSVPSEHPRPPGAPPATSPPG